MREETKFGKIALNIPTWVEGFYAERKTNFPNFVQLIDVPYFGDSKDVHLIQVADFIAYFLRLYAELKEKKRSPKYEDNVDARSFYE